MQERGKQKDRWVRGGAVCLIAIGFILMSATMASAASPGRAFSVIKFWPADNVVTVDVPSACPASRPGCVWRLTVSEPESPAQTVVGTAQGTSGVLTVAYPADFCGVLQADVSVGPAPWRKAVGHRHTIQTAACGPVTQATGGVPPTQNATQLPFTDVVSAGSTAADAQATLPFTGLDVRPLAIAGMSLV
ncbi:MAG: hypothetical protein ACRDYE_00560, partial [Acidimicrobiales bacterium]